MAFGGTFDSQAKGGVVKCTVKDLNCLWQSLYKDKRKDKRHLHYQMQ